MLLGHHVQLSLCDQKAQFGAPEGDSVATHGAAD